MIRENEFPQWQNDAEEIDAELYYPNVSILKCGPKDIPHATFGTIWLRDLPERERFRADAAHEAAHVAVSPVTYHNQTVEIKAITEKVESDKGKAAFLANVANDMIVEFHLSKTPLREDAKKGWILDWEKCEDVDHNSPFVQELFAVYSELYGCEFKGLTHKTNNFAEIKRIVEEEADIEKRHVEIARIFKPFVDADPKRCKQPQQGEDSGTRLGNLHVPSIMATDEETKDEIKNALAQGSDVNEARELINIIVMTGSGPGTETGQRMLRNDYELLRQFYDAQARKVILSLDFPEVTVPKGVKLGLRKWRTSDGAKNMDIYRSVRKHGVAIPLVTIKTQRTLPKFVSSITSKNPMPITVSVDTSGSTHLPIGTMKYASDFEAVMFFGLINIAKKIQQRIGLTLWETILYYHQEPLDWREADRLKDAILRNWRGGGTRICEPLAEAQAHPNRLYFIFTDGDVYEGDLKPYRNIKNVMFFLTKPSRQDHVQMFKKNFPQDQITVINDLKRLPRVVLSHWRDRFYKS